MTDPTTRPDDATEVDPETAALSLIAYALQPPLTLTPRRGSWHGADARYVRNRVYDAATTAMVEATNRLQGLIGRAEAVGLRRDQIQEVIRGGSVETGDEGSGVSS